MNVTARALVIATNRALGPTDRSPLPACHVRGGWRPAVPSAFAKSNQLSHRPACKQGSGRTLARVQYKHGRRKHTEFVASCQAHVASSPFLPFLACASCILVNSFSPPSNFGRSFGHRLPFKTFLLPVVVKVLLPAPLVSRSSVELPVAPPSSSVVSPPCEIPASPGFDATSGLICGCA